MSTQNPYAPPNAKVQDGSGIADIDNLDVSDAWKQKFRAIHRAGGPSLPDFKKLTPEERKAVPTFSILAFFFGPFYYLFKGMWRKAITLFVLSVIGIVILDTVMTFAGLVEYTRATGFAAAAAYAVLANRDYYRKMVLGQNGWW